MSDKKPEHARDPKTPTWATECPTRSPKFKVHNTIGHAKSAVTNRVGSWTTFGSNNWDGGAKRAIIDVYEMVDGEWVHHPEMSIGPDTHEFYEYQSPWNARTYWKLRRREQ